MWESLIRASPKYGDAPDLPNANFFSLPQCDHTAGNGSGDLVIPHLKAFLLKVHTSARGLD
jgi:hypothetical protein